jgi:Fe-S-cluster containining protein
MRSAFPGDAATGLLGDDDSTEERFCERFAHLPCPALDPASGRCDLYASRPLSCRTYGPPVRLEGEDLPPCELCFVGSKAADVDAARVSIDVADAEHSLIERVGAPDARGTLVAFALLR